LWRGLNDPQALGSEDIIEGRDEFGVPVTDQEPKCLHPTTHLHDQVPGLLGHPRPTRVGGDAGQVQPAGAVFDEHQDI
jgi:hypothetical protein